ncbi:MAG: secondary thiamine-phosphate synthase enzyme YjbQ [Desulfobacterales bacterium]
MLTVKTSHKTQFVDITNDVKRLVRESGVREGILIVYVPHTTAGVTINENADPEVQADILTSLNTIVPENATYRHLEGNSSAHIKSSLIGASQCIPITGGDVCLGTWQGIFFCEFDGPRERKAYIRILEGRLR